MSDTSDEWGVPDGFLKPFGPQNPPTDNDNDNTGAAITENNIIGPYRLLEPLGEGGMGVVYLADQQAPIKRQVALKVIKLGMDTKAVVARFHAEKQTLAALNHPAIATVLDAGATKAGRSYFVMEYVNGRPITDVCDRARMTTDDRLQLFLQVCDALQHAHQKGVIHRDIKPSNILVTEADNRFAPKVIDFGIAKAIDRSELARTTFTEQGQVIGTPEYMSPEQAGMVASDVDTRTDIYSLGVLLYEVLVGALPFDLKAARIGHIGDLQRLLHDTEPPIPSSRVSTLSAVNDSLAQLRQSDPKRLYRALKGDLDWIVMKCLEKDRARRYASVGALVDDLNRYLRNEPVLAGPPSARYRMRKFARRHRTLVIAASSIAAVLLLSSIALGALAYWALDQRDLAERREKIAERERRNAEAINALVTNALIAANPSMGGSIGLLVTDAMNQAIGELDVGALRDQPETEARLRLTIARILNDNGDPKSGLRQAQQAHYQLKKLHGDRHQTLVPALVMVGRCQDSNGEWEQALTTHQAALDLQQALNPDDIEQVAECQINIASCLVELGRFDAGSKIYESALQSMQDHVSGDHETIATLQNDLAVCLKRQGRIEEALPYFESSLVMRRRLHPGNHPDVARQIDNLANCLRDLGRADDAMALSIEAVDMMRDIYPDGHPSLAHQLSNVGSGFAQAGEFERAINYLEEARRMFESLFPDGHISIPNVKNSIASIHYAHGDYQKALTMHRAVLDARRTAYGDVHPLVASSTNNIANCLFRLERVEEALPMVTKALEMRRKLFEGDHPDLVVSLSSRALCLDALARFDEAKLDAEAALAMIQRMIPGDHFMVAWAHTNLASVLESTDRYDEALKHYNAALKMRRRLYPERDHPELITSLNKLAACLANMNRAAGGLTYAEQARSMADRVYPDGHPERIMAQVNMGNCLRLQGRHAEALPVYQKALAECTQLLPVGHDLTNTCQQQHDECLAKMSAP